MPVSTIVFRSTLRPGVVVSTARIGRGGRYETSYIVDGIVSDPEVSTSKGEAGIVHDKACAVVLYPSSRDPRDAGGLRLVRLFEGACRDREATRGIGPRDLAPALAAVRVERLG